MKSQPIPAPKSPWNGRMFMLLCLILLGVTLSALYPLRSQLLEFSKQIEGTKEQIRSLRDELSQRANARDPLKAESDKGIRDQLAKAGGEIDEALKPVIAAVKDPVDARTLIARLADLQHTIQRAAEPRYRKIDALTDWNPNAADKAKQTQKALEFAQKAKTDGQLDLAKIYYISAISHSPDDPAVLSAYADAVFASKPSAEDVARLRSITQVAMYQISPEEIPKALAILAKTTPVETAQSSQPGKNAPQPDWAGRLQSLTGVPLDTIFSDPGKLQTRMDGLTEVADALADQPSPNGELEKRLTAELRKTEQTLTAMRTTALLDQYLTNLAEAVDNDPIKAISIVQAAESAMAQLWSLDLKGLPGPLQKKIDAYPLKLKVGVDQIAEVKSAPFLAEIEKQFGRWKGRSPSSGPPKIGTPGPLQADRDMYDEYFRRAQQAYAQISSEAARKKAEPTLIGMGKFVVLLQKEQFDAYQKWVVDTISGAFNADKREWITWKSDTMKRFNDYMIVNIDQSSLSPETARVFNDVIGKFLTNLDAERVVAVEHEMSKTEKMKPENF